MSCDDVNSNSDSTPEATPDSTAESTPDSVAEPSAKPAAPRRKRLPPWRRLLKSNLFRTIVLFSLLLWYGTYRFEKLILNPPEKDWGPVAVEDLSAERWYETEH